MNIYKKMLLDSFNSETQREYTWQEVLCFIIWFTLEYIKFLAPAVVIALCICLYAYFNTSVLDILYPIP